METEVPLLKKLPSFRPRFDSTSTVGGETSDLDDNIPRYTSLKDLILSSSPKFSATREGSAFDSSTISIRNELVKYAASAYVQSATILVNRDQDWLAGFLERINSYVASNSCWHDYFRVPLRSCLRPILRFLNYLVSRIGGALS